MTEVTTLGILAKEPIPVIKANTTYFPAGAVTIAVEDRTLHADAVERAFREASSASEERIQEVVRRARAQETDGQADGGPALHVLDTATGLEYFRIDAFREAPHYHYLIPGERNIRVLYDDFANGDVIDWAVDKIGARLPELLTAAGAAELAAKVDRAAVAAIVPAVAQRAREIAGAARA
jgi:hypothetical protein